MCPVELSDFTRVAIDLLCEAYFGPGVEITDIEYYGHPQEFWKVKVLTKYDVNTVINFHSRLIDAIAREGKDSKILASITRQQLSKVRAKIEEYLNLRLMFGNESAYDRLAERED